MTAVTAPIQNPALIEGEHAATAGSDSGGADMLEQLRPLWWLACELALQIPVSAFTVGELLRLRSGSLISTGWNRSTEVPLYANGQRIGSSEFEAVGDHIGARITELL